MPARPHRTVDRVIQIRETVSLRPRGVSLAELATALDAAKSSVQELTNGCRPGPSLPGGPGGTALPTGSRESPLYDSSDGE
jgi:hypothetical protein